MKTNLNTFNNNYQQSNINMGVASVLAEFGYNIVYDDKYFGPGYLIYRNDHNQFLKIISDQAGNLKILVSDNHLDQPKKTTFRPISFAFTKDSPFYTPFYNLYETTIQNTKRNVIFSKNQLQEGYNQIQFFPDENSLQVVFIKDLTHSKNLNSNAMSLQITGNIYYHFLELLNEIHCEKDYGKIAHELVYLEAS